MSALGFFGGLAGAYQGIQKGIDDAKTRDDVDKRRQWAEEDQAWQTESRGMLREKSNRDLEEGRRQDERRRKIVALPKIGDSVDIPGQPATDVAPAADVVPSAASDKLAPPDPSLGNSDVVGVESPTLAVKSDAPASAPASAKKKLPTRKYSYADHLRDLAKIEQESANAKGAIELNQAADKWTLDQAGQRLNTLIASSASLTDAELATNAASMFNEDPLPAQVRNLKANPDGSFTATIYGTDSGKELPVRFKDRNEMLRGLQAHYQPDNFSKLQMSAEQARMKAQEEIDKAKAKSLYEPKPVGRGGVYVPDGRGGGSIVGGDASAGAGAGKTGKTGKVAGSDDVLNDTLEFIGKNSSLKDSPPELTARIQQYAFQVVKNSNGKVPPQLAASIAIDAGNNPAKLQPRLDLSTGSIDQVYDSPEAGEIKFSMGYASAQQPNGLTTKQMQNFANQLVAAQPPAIKNQLVSAAFDGKERAKLESSIKAEINAAFDQQLKDNPNAKEQIEARRQATVNSSLESLGRKLNLVYAHYPKPKPAPTAAKPGASAVPKVGGILPSSNKYAGMTRRQMDEADAKEARDWRAANQKVTSDPSKTAAAKLRIAQLEQQRSSLLRQNKAVDANAATEEIRKLKSQYGI